MTSSQMEEEECSLDIEGYLSPNSLPHAQKHLDPIPEDESGYLLANHLPETLSEAVIKDEETKSVSSEKSGQTTNGLQASKNSSSSGKDIWWEGLKVSKLCHNSKLYIKNLRRTSCEKKLLRYYRGDCCDDPPLCVCCVPIASCLHLPPIYWSWTHPGNKDQKVPDDPIMHVGQQTFMSSTCAHSLISAAFKTYNTFNIKKLLQRNNFFPSKFIPYSLQYKPNSPKVCILNIIWRLA